jgi:TonB-linked SusC/RagA family outer membrane protein
MKEIKEIKIESAVIRRIRVICVPLHCALRFVPCTVHLFLLLVSAFWSYGRAQTMATDTVLVRTRDIAYGEQAEWKVTGAVSTVKGETLAKSFTTNVANTLNGRLPGLTLHAVTGEAGADAPAIYMRGINSFNGGTEVFIVIDGLPSSITFFEQLSVHEIESITVLKDAAASAIYGQRAANGVLLVKTKRGFVSPLQVQFGAQYGFQQIPRTPDFLNSHDYAYFYNEALRNEGQPERYTVGDLEAYRTGSNPLLYPDVNWQEEVLRKSAPLSNYNFNARGGTETIKYFVLFNAINNRGIYKRTEKVSENALDQSYTRYNFRTNVDVQLAKNLSMMTTISGSVEDKVTPGVNETTQAIFDLMASIPPNAFAVNVGNGRPGGSSFYRNPWAEITQRGYVSYNGRSAQATSRLVGDLSFITPGLSASASVGFNSHFISFSNKTKDYARYSVSGIDSEGQPVYSPPYGQETPLTINESDSYQWRNLVVQGSLNYDRTFGSQEVNAILTANYDDATEVNRFISASLPYKNLGAGGRFTYAAWKRYIVEFSFGYYGNDRFMSGKRFGFFPAGSLGWVVSNEAFLKDNQAINFLKIKGSYGLTGNWDTGGERYTYHQSYRNANYYLGANNSWRDGYLQNTIATPNATWEKEKQLNIGLEGTLFRNFYFTFDGFKRNRYDILALPQSTLPDFSGFILPYANVGKVENKGFEAVVGYKANVEKDLSWFAEGSGWFSRNKILYNAEAPQAEAYLYQTGYPVGQSFLLEYDGFFYDANEIAQHVRQSFDDVQPGDVRYKNQNGDDVIDTNDVRAAGYSVLPELTLGLHAGLAYKGFDVDVFFQGAVNRSVYWQGKYFEAFQNNGKITSVALDRWAYYPELGIDTRSTATYPRLSASDNQNNYQASTLWLKNGNFLKLRSLEIGYTLPSFISGKIQAESVRFFLNGTNLLSFDYMDGVIDPEEAALGVAVYPVMRTFSAGINIQF